MKSRLLAGCLFLVYSAWGQAKRVSVSPPDPFSIHHGSTASQTIHVVIQEGSHVNSEKPRGEFLIPFKLEWEPGPLTASAIHYPTAEELQVGPDKLLVYTGSFGVKTEFKAASTAAPSTMELKGKLHFQACNTQMCFRPATIDIVLPVTIQ